MKNLLLLVCLVACAAPLSPPSSYSIDPAFSESETAAIEAAIEAWCDAAGDCPLRAPWTGKGRGRFELVDDIPESERCAAIPGCVVNGRNTDNELIRIARNRTNPEDLGALWHIAAHEWGHFCIEEHLGDGLMAARMNEGLEIDQGAVDAWRNGCP